VPIFDSPLSRAIGRIPASLAVPIKRLWLCVRSGTDTTYTEDERPDYVILAIGLLDLCVACRSLVAGPGR
jgi:hypothetical protein